MVYQTYQLPAPAHFYKARTLYIGDGPSMKTPVPASIIRCLPLRGLDVTPGFAEAGDHRRGPPARTSSRALKNSRSTTETTAMT